MHPTNPVEQETPHANQSTLVTVARWVMVSLAVMLAALEAISIHSLLVRSPAIGAIQGLVLTTVLIAGVALTLLPKDERRQTLSRLLLFLSAMAVVAAIVLGNKLLLAQGDRSDASAAIQTGLFLIFQTGWACTYWLSQDKARTAQARYLPAVMGSVVLIVGGFLSGGERRAQPTPQAQTDTYIRYPKPAELESVRETDRAGTDKGTDFVHFHAGGEPLLGIAFSTRDWMRRERIDRDLRGVFDRDAPVDGGHVILASPGFAVAMIEVQADHHINAIRVEFGPIDGSLISYENRYLSDWAGSYKAGESTTRLDAMDEIVVGLSGTISMVVNSMGLLVDHR